MKKIIFSLIIVIFFTTSCGTTSKNEKDIVNDNIIAAAGNNYSNEKICWGFRKIKNSSPEVSQSAADILKRYDGYYLGDTTKKVLYLTFDEGYENGYTACILDTLKETQTPAAFFVTGPYLKGQKDLITRMVKEGHIVGNHTVNHPSMPSCDDEKIKCEIDNLNKDFFALTGTNMKFFRPPMGEFSERTVAITKEIGYKTILWSSAYVDWDVNKQLGTQNAVEKITNQLHNGNIILMHAVSRDNANALAEIIKTAKNQGYVFKSLNDL